MVWYCDRCKSYHEDGQLCPNMGVLDPIISFFGGVIKGHQEASEKVEVEHKEWQKRFDEDNRLFQERLHEVTMQDIAAKHRREELQFNAQVMRENSEKEAEILRLRIQLEKEKQKQTSQKNKHSSKTHDPFIILGVPRNASQSQVIEAFKDLTQYWNPNNFVNSDRRIQQLAFEKFQKIKRAYDDIMRLKGWI
jgi:hypothetical protein